MKGTLHERHNVWVVKYDDIQASSSAYPIIHKEFLLNSRSYAAFISSGYFKDGDEVEFDIVKEDRQHRFTNGEWDRSYSEQETACIFITPVKPQESWGNIFSSYDKWLKGKEYSLGLFPEQRFNPHVQFLMRWLTEDYLPPVKRTK